MIDGATRLLLIVGDPVEHARSPVAVNALLSCSGTNAVLVPWHAPDEAFEAIMAGVMRTANLAGIVVTYPFKQRAMALAATVTSVAARVGAVNALRREANGRWHGGMFDGAGLVRAAEGLGRPVAGQRVKLMGAGGAGTAIAHALAEAGAAALDVFDRDRARAEALVAAVRSHAPACRAGVGGPGVGDATLLVNATPVGMAEGDAPPGDPAALTAATAVVDIVPRAAGTALLRLARERGCPHAGGAAMVESQAAALLEFFGLLPHPAAGKA